MNMGVKFKDIVSPEEINLKDLEGRTVAIDAYIQGSCRVFRP